MKTYQWGLARVIGDYFGENLVVSEKMINFAAVISNSMFYDKTNQTTKFNWHPSCDAARYQSSDDV